jgi:hypothetical protein
MHQQFNILIGINRIKKTRSIIIIYCRLIALFDKISDSDLNFSLDKLYTIKPTDIL